MRWHGFVKGDLLMKRGEVADDADPKNHPNPTLSRTLAQAPNLSPNPNAKPNPDPNPSPSPKPQP
eukprot:scaffold59882_cov33-Phaeocystis_antarctica.AAC.1